MKTKHHKASLVSSTDSALKTLPWHQLDENTPLVIGELPVGALVKIIAKSDGEIRWYYMEKAEGPSGREVLFRQGGQPGEAKEANALPSYAVGTLVTFISDAGPEEVVGISTYSQH